MADFKPRYVINTSNGTANLELFVSEVLVTTYSFEDNEVTLSERPDITVVTLQQLNENIEAINLWSALVKKELKPPRQGTAKFRSEMEKDESGIESTYTALDVQVTHAQYLLSTGLISFDPRPEMTMGFYDYCAWAAFLDRLYRDIRDF